MDKGYKFKIKLLESGVLPILKIKALRSSYPISFKEINVPIAVSKTGNYELDFKNSSDSSGNSYAEAFKLRDKQREVLGILEQRIKGKIVDSLNGDNVFSGKGNDVKIVYGECATDYQTEKRNHGRRGRNVKEHKKARRIKVI